MFSLTLLLLCLTGSPAQQTPPRDPRAAVAGATAETSGAGALESALQKKIEASPSDPSTYLALAKMQEDRGAYADAEATFGRAREAAPGKKEVPIALAGFYTRRGSFERAIAALEDAARLTPNDPAGYHLIATYYWEKAYRDNDLSPTARWTYIFEGINATDKALALNPDYGEALTYKNILLRMRANLETDPAQKKSTLAEADTLRNRAIELNKWLGGSSGASLISSSGQAVPPPPPPPDALGQAPLRVGGNIRPPVKTRHVPPVYPPAALEAKIQGIVILEATIAADGRVADARVLKSIPDLDQAAVDAVRQWAFQPTLLNGVAVPVVMTVTVNFTLQ
jgi:protein TonB